MRGFSVGMLKETFARFGADQASMLAAAIAYSTAFAIAPLIIIAIAIAGSLLGVTDGGHGHHVIEDELVGAIASSAGRETATLVRQMVDSMFSSHQGSVLAQTAGWATFAMAASGLFMTLQTALNDVWHVKPKQQGLWVTVRARAASAAMLVVIGILALATIGLNVAMAFFWTHVNDVLHMPGASLIASALSYVVDIAIASIMFALMYKVLPDVDVAWGDVGVGSIATAVLFVVGEGLLSLYITHAGLGNGYGAAGSLVVLLVWVYYSAMLLLVGAEFTRVYAEYRGSPAAREAARDGDPSTRGATTLTTAGATTGERTPAEGARRAG